MNNYVQDHHFCLNTFDEQLSFKCKPLKKRCEFLAYKIRLQDMNVSQRYLQEIYAEDSHSTFLQYEILHRIPIISKYNRNLILESQ